MDTFKLEIPTKFNSVPKIQYRTLFEFCHYLFIWLTPPPLNCCVCKISITLWVLHNHFKHGYVLSVCPVFHHQSDELLQTIAIPCKSGQSTHSRHTHYCEHHLQRQVQGQEKICGYVVKVQWNTSQASITVIISHCWLSISLAESTCHAIIFMTKVFPCNNHVDRNRCHVGCLIAHFSLESLPSCFDHANGLEAVQHLTCKYTSESRC